MEESEERKFVCKFCCKKFPSGKSLGGHIRIHSDRYSGNKNKKLVDQREIVAPKQQQQQQQQQLCCTECGKEFLSLKSLCAHMAFHSKGEKLLMASQYDTETSSAPSRKRSKRVMRQCNSESLSHGSSSVPSEIDQEDKDGAFSLMVMLTGSSFKEGHNLMMRSLGELSDNNSAILETSSSSGKELNIVNTKNHVLETDRNAVDDQLRSAEDTVSLCDSDSSDSDYFMNGPKKSDSEISLDGSLRNTGFGSGFNNSLNRIRNSNEGRSENELSKSKRALSYETDSFADTGPEVANLFRKQVVKRRKAKDSSAQSASRCSNQAKL